MWKRLVTASLLLLLLAGCNGDDCVDCPGDPPPPQPTLANVWPHADGTGWIYDLDYSERLDPGIADPAAPLPSLQDLHDALDLPAGSQLVREDRGLYRLRFDGAVTTGSGVTAQRLTGTIYDEADPDGFGGAGAEDGERALLRLVARVRPDLRPRILARLGEDARSLKDLAGVDTPYFLGGYAFAFEDSGYYGYGDLNTSHSWVYLEGDLAVGAQFSLKLVPDLAADIWLYGQVWSIGDRTVGGVVWPNVLECMYAIDLGLSVLTDESGTAIGEFRSYIYGTTFFAPEFGPIAGRERRILAPQQIMDGPEAGTVIDYTCVIAR